MDQLFSSSSWGVNLHIAEIAVSASTFQGTWALKIPTSGGPCRVRNSVAEDEVCIAMASNAHLCIIECC